MSKHPLEKIIENTLGFDRLIDEQNWDELEVRVKERHKDLESIFSRHIEEKHKPTYRDFIQQIQLADIKYEKKIKAIKSDLSGEMNELRTNFHAIQAYMNVDR